MTTMTMNREHLLTAQEAVDLEKRYWDALKDRDIRTVGRLSAPDSLVAGASGVSVISQGSLSKMIEAATYRIRDYQIDPTSAQVMPICDDTIAVGYRVTENLEVDGKPIFLEAFDTSVWRKNADGWTCVLHSESIAGDPFGRDRMANAPTS